MNQSYRTPTDGNTPDLSEAHRRMLYEESRISPEVVAERVQTAAESERAAREHAGKKIED